MSSLVSDAISVDDTSSPIVDEALLATASIYSIELCVGTILLTAPVSTRHGSPGGGIGVFDRHDLIVVLSQVHRP